MELIVTAGGEVHEVTVRHRGGHLEVTVGGHSYRVDEVAVGEHRRSLLIDGGQYQVSVRPGRDADYAVDTAYGSETVQVTDPLTHRARAAAAAAGATGRRQVTAYMPGRVAAVLKEEGDEVAAGEGVVVLEAMKMENEIPADGDGVVSKILVEAGQAVEGGDPLFELE